MEVTELKKLLAVSKHEPVGCAVGIVKDGTAQILLHKAKAPRALLGELEKDAGKLTGPGFGTAFVDTETDPKLVVLTLNKAVGGLGRKLKKTLRGSGFSKVEIRLEDGSVAESVGEEDEEGAPAASSPSAPEAAASDMAASSLPPLAGQPEMAARAAELPGLIKQVSAAMAADPSRSATLKTLAAGAVAAAKGQDLAQATEAVSALKAGLEAGASAPVAEAPYDVKALQAELSALIPTFASATGGDAKRLGALRAAAGEMVASLKAGDGAKASAGLDSIKAMLAAKGNGTANGGTPLLQIWREAKETVDQGISALQKACLSHNEPSVGALLKDVADKGLNGVTDRVAVGMMAAVLEAESSPAARIKAMKAVDNFQAFLATPVAGMIDDNPFGVPVKLRATFGDALKTIRIRLAA